MEVRELLDFYRFDGDETPVIQVRALLSTGRWGGGAATVPLRWRARVREIWSGATCVERTSAVALALPVLKMRGSCPCAIVDAVIQLDARVHCCAACLQGSALKALKARLFAPATQPIARQLTRTRIVAPAASPRAIAPARDGVLPCLFFPQ